MSVTDLPAIAATQRRPLGNFIALLSLALALLAACFAVEWDWDALV